MSSLRSLGLGFNTPPPPASEAVTHGGLGGALGPVCPRRSDDGPALPVGNLRPVMEPNKSQSAFIISPCWRFQAEAITEDAFLPRQPGPPPHFGLPLLGGAGGRLFPSFLTCPACCSVALAGDPVRLAFRRITFSGHTNVFLRKLDLVWGKISSPSENCVV